MQKQYAGGEAFEYSERITLGKVGCGCVFPWWALSGVWQLLRRPIRHKSSGPQGGLGLC